MIGLRAEQYRCLPISRNRAHIYVLGSEASGRCHTAFGDIRVDERAYVLIVALGARPEVVELVQRAAGTVYAVDGVSFSIH